MAYFGNAALIWSATSDANTQRVHQLAAPLRLVKPSENLLAFQADSLDRTVRDYWTVGAGAYELLGTVKYSYHHQSLVDLLRAGNQGLTLTYYPSLADSGTNYACKLISPVTPFDLALDGDRERFGEHQVELRLRLTNQAPFQPLMAGSDVLFRFNAGQSLAGATFTRATSTSAPATYAGLGYGTVTTAKSNKARVDWISTNSSQGPRTMPVLLLEDTRTNAIKDSANFGTANWTVAGSLSRSSAKTDPKGGTAAWKLTDASTSALGLLSQVATVPSSGQQALSCFVAASTSSFNHLLIQSTNAGTTYARGSITWSSGVPTFTAQQGKIFSAPPRYSNGFYRFGIISASSAPLAAGAKVKVSLIPSSEGVGGKGSMLVYGAQLE